MATAFGRPRPKTGRTVDDIARMSPEEWRELQDEIQRDYAKRFLGLWDASAAVRRFQKDAETARQRQARPSPFGGGEGPRQGGFSVGQPIEIGPRPALRSTGVLPYPPYPPDRATHTLDFEMTAPSPSGALPLGPGGPLGVSRATLPGALPVGGASLPLGPQTGTPGAGFGTGAVDAADGQSGAPATAGPATAGGEGGGFDPKIAAMLLASMSDAVKENLTLQGARGAKGTTAPNLLQMIEQERRAKHEDMTYRLELSKWLSQEPERRLKALTTFADLAVKVGDLAATADPEQQKVIRSGLEQQAEQLGMPKSWVGDYLGQSQATLGSIRDLLPHIDPASLQLLMMQSKSLLKSGKFLETAQQAASFGIRGKIGERLPNVLASLDKQAAYQGKDKPFDLVVDLVAGEDRAIRDYLMGATAPKDEYERLTKRLAGMGVAMPEEKAAIGAKVAEAKALMPTELEKAEALERIKQRLAGTAALTPQQIGQIRDDYLNHPRSKEFEIVRNAYANIQDATKAGTPAGDVVIVFGFMHLVDPTSTVREGEQAQVRNAAGVEVRIRTLYNGLLTGENLHPTQRADILARTESIFRQRIKAQVEWERQFQSIAKKWNADPAEAVPDVIGEYRSLMTEKKATTKRESLSRKSDTYKEASRKGFTDKQIEEQFNIKLVD